MFRGTVVEQAREMLTFLRILKEHFRAITGNNHIGRATVYHEMHRATQLLRIRENVYYIENKGLFEIDKCIFCKIFLL